MQMHIKKAPILFLLGGSAYVLMELVFRGRSHWTMFLMGGVLFLILGGLNEAISWDMPLLFQGVLGALIVTGTELAAGCVLNLWLGMDIWDYSDLPCNFMGQICLSFSLLWVGVSILAIIVDDWVRYWLFWEEKPHYTLV